MLITRQDSGSGFDIAEAVTNIPGIVWVLAGIVAVVLVVRYLLGLVRIGLVLAALIGLYVLMGAPGLTGSGVAERWNDVKAKAEAFWNAKDVVFDRQG